MRTIATALVVGAAGGLAASMAGLPAPFLLGAAAAVTLGGLAGLRMAVPAPLRDVCFLLLGCAMGARVSPEALAAARQWPVSFAFLALNTGLILVLGSLLLRRLSGFDRRTAVLGSAPGHLSFILGLSDETGADIRKVAIIQSMRVVSLTMLVPVALSLGGLTPVAATRASPPVMAWPDLVLLVAGAAVLAPGLRYLRVPAPFLLAGLVAVAAGHLSGQTGGALPDWLATPAFVVIGALIGTRFSGVSRAELRQLSGAGLALLLLTGALTLATALPAAWILGLPPGTVLVALAPGGVETMAAIAFLMNIDPAFVAAHHLFRLTILSVAIPLLLYRADKKPAGSQPHKPDPP